MKLEKSQSQIKAQTHQPTKTHRQGKSNVTHHVNNNHASFNDEMKKKSLYFGDNNATTHHQIYNSVTAMADNKGQSQKKLPNS